MPTIAILTFPDVQALDVTGPMDVFAEANRYLEPNHHYRLLVIGTERGPFACSNGMLIQPHANFAEFGQNLDLLMVAGGPDPSRIPGDPGLLRWLRMMDGRSTKIASVCTGAFLLAQAGLLDGLRATTHWNDASKLAARFPNVAVESDRIFVKHGRVYTSAGVTAGIDLALYLLHEDHGDELSLNVARRLVVFTQRSGGQSQFSPYLTPYIDEASAMQNIQQFVLGHLGEDLSVDRLARMAAMSARNFSRVFSRQIRLTPAEFVERARVDAARSLLEISSQPLKSIAYRCGFGTTERMRAAFVKNLGVTARQYRLNFGGFADAPPSSPGVYERTGPTAYNQNNRREP